MSRNGTRLIQTLHYIIYLYDAKPVQEAPKAKEKPESYVVQANDSLTSVASQFGLSVKQLADYNDLSTTSGLFVGQKLSLKESASKAKAEDSKKPKLPKFRPSPIPLNVVSI